MAHHQVQCPPSAASTDASRCVCALRPEHGAPEGENGAKRRSWRWPTRVTALERAPGPGEAEKKWGPVTAEERSTSRGAATGRQPGLAKLAALLLGGAAPYPRLLVGGESELQTGLQGVARGAHVLGRLDLVDGRTRRPHREEQVGLGMPTCRQLPPVFCVPLDRAVPHECHDALLGTVQLSWAPGPRTCDRVHMTGHHVGRRENSVERETTPKRSLLQAPGQSKRREIAGES